MAIYKEKEQQYLETDVLSVGLRGSLLHVRDKMWFPSNKVPKTQHSGQLCL